MNNPTLIFTKLEGFIKKYYTNELLRGCLFFIGLGLLYFLFTIFLEYFLWLKPIARTVLFFVFIVVELFLLLRFILFPVFKLCKLQKGIDYEVASSIIGTHFPEVADKLTNFLQLSNNQNQSELLLASIDQKAAALEPIPFSKAVNFRSNKKYIPLTLFPLIIVLFVYLSGNGFVLSDGLHRVVHYKQQFLPPAPFQFQIVNKSLITEQNKDFTLTVTTKGKVVPEKATIFFNDESYFMESMGLGVFKFTIPKPTEDVSFHMEANAVSSMDYTLDVVSVPSITNFQMILNYPSYVNKKSETISGTGNAVIPEGTVVTWKIATVATNQVTYFQSNASQAFNSNEATFSLSKKINENTDYQIHTSNRKIKDYEKLTYQLSVTKDAFPTIHVGPAPDSLKLNANYLLGQVSDDYGLSKLQVVYFPSDQPNQVLRGNLKVKKDLYDQFVYTFPSELPVVPGVTYDYYFEVFDNDAIHHFKSTRSAQFSYREKTETEKQDQLFQQQNSAISTLEKSIKAQEKQLSEMEKLQQMGKEKESLEYKEQQKVNDFLERQMKQDKIMQEFAEKMKDNLDKFQKDKKDVDKEQLEKRLENIDKEFEKNKKLVEELQKLNEKIDKEELFEKMDQLKQQSKNQTKSLEQLVELTKKYYVEKKAEQIAEKLNTLSEKQDQLSESEKENNAAKQEAINKDFDAIQKELDQLQKDNKELKSPMELPDTAPKEKSIEEDLKKASDELKKDAKSAAKPKQKSASKKMKQMSSEMQESMEGGEQEQMEEDIAVLRQILDNLVAYSFSQEEVMNQFRNIKRGSPAFNKFLKTQQDLKQQFKHIDDSLFSMSLRNPKIAENVTKEIGNVQYNVDRALDNLVEVNVPKAASHQQYAVSSSNKLADFLADILTSMQMSMSMSGKGKGKGQPSPGKGSGSGDQLPDIIKKQEGLSEKLKDGMKPGKSPGSKPGEGKEGQGKEGKNKEGKNASGSGNSSGGKDGKDGKDGEGDAQMIMDIYKEQQQLRESLQKELNKQGLGGTGQSTLDQMKQIEKQLLNKGFTNEVLQRMLNIKYELLKLDKAIQQQGEENKRQADGAKKQFTNTSSPLPPALQEYLKSIEILNRQTLPLRSNYNQKVQEYFKRND